MDSLRRAVRALQSLSGHFATLIVYLLVSPAICIRVESTGRSEPTFKIEESMVRKTPPSMPTRSLEHWRPQRGKLHPPSHPGVMIVLAVDQEREVLSKQTGPANQQPIHNNKEQKIHMVPESLIARELRSARLRDLQVHPSIHRRSLIDTSTRRQLNHALRQRRRTTSTQSIPPKHQCARIKRSSTARTVSPN